MEKEQITIRLPADMKEKVQQEADKRGISFNAMIIWFIQEGFGEV